MSKSRKILSVVLAIAMLCSIFAVSAFAAEDTQTWALASEGTSTVTVKVSLTTNYNTGAIEFAIKNTNKTGVAFASVDLGAAVTFNADITANEAADGTVKVVIVPDTNGMADSAAGVVMNGVVAELKYNVTTGASATLTLDLDPKTDTNLDGTLIALRQDKLTSGSLVYGQTVTNTSAPTVSIGAADPELKVIAGTIGVIDTENGYVYGVEVADEDVTDVFEATNGGKVVVEENELDCIGTGALVKVTNADESVVYETYTLIYFGDVDGSGEIDFDDALLISKQASYKGDIADNVDIDGSAAEFAADVDCPGDDIDFDDALMIKRFAGYKYQYTQDEVIDELP